MTIDRYHNLFMFYGIIINVLDGRILWKFDTLFQKRFGSKATAGVYQMTVECMSQYFDSMFPTSNVEKSIISHNDYVAFQGICQTQFDNLSMKFAVTAQKIFRNCWRAFFGSVQKGRPQEIGDFYPHLLFNVFYTCKIRGPFPPLSSDILYERNTNGEKVCQLN